MAPGGPHDHRASNRRSLVIVLILILGNLGLELAGGLVSGSLALLADAVHSLEDLSVVGLALFSLWIAGRPPSIERTFGYHRVEILAAMTNVLTLWLFTAWIFFEAFQRGSEEGPHRELEGNLLILFGALALALALSIVTALVFYRPSKRNFNLAGVFQHILADLMGSVGIVVSGVIVVLFGWVWIDTVISVGIGVLILYSSWGLLRRIFNVLLEGPPHHIDLYRLCSEFELEGVTLVHDVHAWTISSDYEAMTAHILVDQNFQGDRGDLQRRLRRIARDNFGVGHITIQLDDSLDDCDEDHHVGHLHARARASRQT